jgi:archaellum biogenesis ATPase FlaH
MKPKPLLIHENFNMDASDSPLPQNIEAERLVLGSILIDDRLLDKVRTILSLEDFYKEPHKTIFQAMETLGNESSPIDVSTVSEYLRERKGNLLEKVGGGLYITYLTEVVSSTASVEYHAKRVKEKALENNLCKLCMTVEGKLKNEDLTWDKAVEEIQASIDKIQSPDAGKSLNIVSSVDLVDEEDEEADGEIIQGLIYEGAVHVITAPPAGYKSFFVQDLAYRIASGEPFLGRITQQRKVIILDKESPRRELKRRLKKIGSHPNLSIWASSISKTEPPNLDRITSYKKQLEDYDVIIVDSLIRFHDANENDNTEMKKVMDLQRSLENSGKAIITLQHGSPKSEHKYRGASEIQAGCDILYDLAKLDEKALKLSCREKNRFGLPFDIYMTVSDNGEKLSFESSDSPKYVEEQEDLKHLGQVIGAMKSRGIEPIKTKIKEEAKRILSFSEKKTDELLDKGENKLWKQVPGKTHNKKIYDLINDDINSSKNASNSVSQFCTPYRGEKLKNCQTEENSPELELVGGSGEDELIREENGNSETFIQKMNDGAYKIEKRGKDGQPIINIVTPDCEDFREIKEVYEQQQRSD